MTLNDYRRSLKERGKRRAAFHELTAEFDASIILTALGAAPVGLANKVQRSNLVGLAALDRRRLV